MKRHKVEIYKPDRWVYFLKDVDSENILELQQTLTQKFKQQPGGGIVLFINSGGGDADLAVGFYYWTKFLKLNLTTIGMGQLSSAGVVLFLAGNKRYLLPDTYLYFHEGSMPTTKDMSPTEVERAMVRYNFTNQAFNAIICKESLITPEQLKVFDCNASTIHAQEAVTYRLADSILMGGEENLILPAHGTARLRAVS